MDDNFTPIETSIDSAEPIELYLITYYGLVYTYTSTQYPIRKAIDGINYTFVPEYIIRGDSLKFDTSQTSSETCNITVSRLNSVALLYQGAPPEQDTVSIEVYRLHGKNSNELIRILKGVVSQVVFEGSNATLTITIESVLRRTIPKGTLSYFCQNCIYDSKCTLNRDNYKHECIVDQGMYGTTIYSTNLLEIPNEWLLDGYMQMGHSFRAIVEHKDNMIKIKYPVQEADKQANFTVYPGCGNIFEKCAKKFNNTDNFSGIPYVQPYNPYTHASGKGAYWIDSEVIVRDSNRVIYS